MATPIVTVEDVSEGALSSEGKDIAKDRGAKLIQWVKDSFSISEMADLDPLEAISIVLSLQLNEIVRVSHAVGLKKEALDAKLNYIWDNLPKRLSKLANETNKSLN